jgi:RNAse (barnase) inhibitor barstar
MNEYLPVKEIKGKPEVKTHRQQMIQKIIQVLSQQRIQVFYVDGREIFNKETFLKKVGEVMKFPAYFGCNWDAFEECITDLSWCPAEEYVLLYECSDILAQSEPNQWEIALDILRSAEEYWVKTSTPFNLILLN